MSTILPGSRLKATRINPRISIFYGVPKIGKTTMLASLEGCLILDAEKGAESLDVMRVPINSIDGPTVFNADGSLAFTSVNQVCADIEAIGIAEYAKTGKMPKPPYKYIAVDTIDKVEDFCETVATINYKNSTIGKTFDGKSVLDLPNGGGYYHLRNEVLNIIDRLAAICEHLILISHVRDKNINKGGIDVSVRDISLTGRLGAMVAARADVIGYIYREPGKNQLMVSFETFENGVMGARFARLAGRKFPFSWDEIFLKEAPVDGTGTPVKS